MKLEREKREPYKKRPQTKLTEMLETAEREQDNLAIRGPGPAKAQGQDRPSREAEE